MLFSAINFSHCFHYSGPPRIPIFGSYLLMLFLDRHHMQRAANLFTKWYKSNIIGLYLGTTPAIILNDTEKVKKALFVREFDGKPDLLIGRLRDPNFNLRGMYYFQSLVMHSTMCSILFNRNFFHRRTFVA